VIGPVASPVQLKGGMTTPLTATRAVSTPLGSVLDACSRPPSIMATKAKIPTQVPMILFLPMFVVSLSSTNIGRQRQMI